MILLGYFYVATLTEKFINSLQRFMDENGVSQREIAEIVGLSPAAVNHWMKGRRSPDLDQVGSIIEYYRLDLGEFIEGKIKSPPKMKPTLKEALAVVNDQLAELELRKRPKRRNNSPA